MLLVQMTCPLRMFGWTTQVKHEIRCRWVCERVYNTCQQQQLLQCVSSSFTIHNGPTLIEKVSSIKIGLECILKLEYII